MATRLSRVKVGLIGVASWALVLLALWFTTPASLKPIGVTIWFVLLLVGFSSGLAILLDTLKRLIGRKKPQGRAFQPSLRQGIIFGTWLTIIVASSSLRQLSLRDILLTGLIAIIIELYLRLTK